MSIHGFTVGYLCLVQSSSSNVMLVQEGCSTGIGYVEQITPVRYLDFLFQRPFVSTSVPIAYDTSSVSPTHTANRSEAVSGEWHGKVGL